MIRITKRNPYWQDEEFWVNAERPSKEEIDVVYNNLKRYEDEEEDGKIVRIPFMPGTTVYNSSLFKDRKIREGGIIEIRVDEHEKRLKYAKENTALPDAPDMKKIEQLVMEINRRAIDEDT